MANLNYNFNDNLLPTGMVQQLGNWGVTDGKLYSTGTSTGAKALIIEDVGASDGVASAIGNNGAASTGFIGIVFRYADNNNFMLASVNASANDAATVRLMQYSGASWTTLVAVDMVGFWRSDDFTISVSFIGEDINITVNDTLYVTTTSAFNLTSTGIGFRSDSTSAKYFDDFVFTEQAAASLTIQNYALRQQVGGVATVPIVGVLTGTTTALEYRLNSGAWTTAINAPPEGAYSFNLVVPEGQNTVSVRFADSITTTATANFISALDVVVGVGQSDSSARGTNNQVYSRGAGGERHILLTNANTYQELADPWDSNVGQVESALDDAGAAGSCMLRFAHHYMLNTDTPMGFVPANKGATTIEVWAKGGALYTAMANRINLAGGCKYIVWQQGQSNVGDETAVHQAALQQLVNDFIADFGCKVIIVELQGLTADTTGNSATVDKIRQAQRNVAAQTDGVYITVPNTDIDTTVGGDGTHLMTDLALDTVGSRIYDALHLANNPLNTLTLSNTDIPDGTHNCGIFIQPQTGAVDFTAPLYAGAITATAGGFELSVDAQVGDDVIIIFPDGAPTAGGAYLGVIA